jgi:hypothetical protein
VRVQAAIAVLVSAGAAVAAPREASLYQQKTADFLTHCNLIEHDECVALVNQALKTLEAEAAIGRGRNLCAPLPLRAEQSDDLIIWILSNPAAANGFAADDLSLAARTLWPCQGGRLDGTGRTR